MNALPVHLHQIAYSPASLAAVEPGYRVLDNLANGRPDWYEYGPIRRFLQHETLDETAFYAFFSTKFGTKTGLRHAEVVAEVTRAAPSADVVLFSPHPNQIAFFLNVFEQGEFFHAGLMAAANGWLHAIGQQVLLQQLVMSVRQTVFCNYFVARPAFWREWLRWNETLYALCEGPDSALRAQLVEPTSYVGGTQRKIFIMTRTASLLLAIQPQWRSHALNPYRNAADWPTAALREDPSPALACDALKHAYLTQHYPHYLKAFNDLRQQVLGLQPARR